MEPSSHRRGHRETGIEPEEDRLSVLAIGVGVLALFVALVRLYGLGTWSLWLDEALTLVDAERGGGAHNPLGYRLFGFLYELGDGRPDEFRLRAPAAAAGWLVVPAMWFFGRRLVGSFPAALGSLFVALSTWHVYWSQNARFYTLAQLAALVGGALVVTGALRGSLFRLACGFLFVGVGAFVHPSVAFFGAGLFLTPLLFRFWPGASRPTPGVLVFLALLALGGAVGGFGWAREVWERWEANKGQGNPVHFVITTGYLLTPLLGLAWLVGSWRSLRTGSVEARFISCSTILSLVLALAASCVSRMSAQYVFCLLPWLALGAGYAFRGSSGRGLLWPALVLLPLLVETGLYVGVRHGDRPRWREAFHYVFSERGETDLVLGMEAPVGEFYLDPYRTDLREWRGVTWLDRYRPDEHVPWLRHGRPIWFVVNQEQFEDWEREDARALKRFLEESCEKMRDYPIPLTPRDLDVTVYRWSGA